MAKNNFMLANDLDTVKEWIDRFAQHEAVVDIFFQCPDTPSAQALRDELTPAFAHLQTQLELDEANVSATDENVRVRLLKSGLQQLLQKKIQAQT